ncbi:acetylxylan esterase [Alienimonas sp. DA493]|uniref:glucuronyl esterase domain-containing protein n=1 Tax=Alienimonas sp. DA493 TaxID=3373605 RepID=UPI003754C9C9
MIAALLLLAAGAPPADAAEPFPDPALVETMSAATPRYYYREEELPEYTLPPVLDEADAPEDWPERRTEIVKLFEQHVYGVAPPAPEEIGIESRGSVSEDTDTGERTSEEWRTVSLTCETPTGPFSFPFTVVLPREATPGSPVPLFVLIAHPARMNKLGGEDGRTTSFPWEDTDFLPWKAIVEAGFAAAVLPAGELAPDDRETFQTKLLAAYGRPEGVGEGRADDAPGNIAAWAWGASRIVDYAEQTAELDATKVAVIGHSRGGKTAWWAGARDPRFSVVISNESGCGGAALSRRQYGETVGLLTEVRPHWFCPRYAGYGGPKGTFEEGRMPVDQHLLAAAIAPRAVYAASAAADLNADPYGEFLSLVEANPAFALFGDPALTPQDFPPVGGAVVRGRRGYHLRPGRHDLKREDWARFLPFAADIWGAADAPEPD